MTIRLSHAKFTGLAVGLFAGTLLLAAAGHSHAAPQVCGVGVKPVEGILHPVQGRPHDRGTLFRPPTTIKPPLGPRVRNNRGDATKFVAPTCGHHPRPCKGLSRK